MFENVYIWKKKELFTSTKIMSAGGTMNLKICLRLHPTLKEKRKKKHKNKNTATTIHKAIIIRYYIIYI